MNRNELKANVKAERDARCTCTYVVNFFLALASALRLDGQHESVGESDWRKDQVERAAVQRAAVFDCHVYAVANLHVHNQNNGVRAPCNVLTIL